MATDTDKIGIGDLATQPDKVVLTLSTKGITEEILRIDLGGYILVRGNEVHCECKVCMALKEWAKKMGEV